MGFAACYCWASTRAQPGSRRPCSTSSCGRCARRAATRSTAIRSRAGSSRTARRCSPRWSRRSPSCSPTLPSEVVACGLDHQGESVLAWDAETGTPLTPIVVWQDKRSQEVLDRLTEHEPEIQELQRPAVRPLLLRRQAGLAARARGGRPQAPARPARCAWARSTRSCATASAPASPPTRRPPRAPSCTRSAGPASTHAWASCSACRWTCCPRCATPPAELGVLRHESWPVELPLCGQVVDQQAALAGAGCVVPGRVKATYGTGVFVLGPHRRRGAPPGRRPAADGGVANRRPHRVRGGRRRVRRGRDARVDVPRAGHGRASRRAGRAGPRGRRQRRRARAARRWPASARRGGAPRRAP